MSLNFRHKHQNLTQFDDLLSFWPFRNIYFSVGMVSPRDNLYSHRLRIIYGEQRKCMPCEGTKEVTVFSLQRLVSKEDHICLTLFIPHLKADIYLEMHHIQFIYVTQYVPKNICSLRMYTYLNDWFRPNFVCFTLQQYVSFGFQSEQTVRQSGYKLPLHQLLQQLKWHLIIISKQSCAAVQSCKEINFSLDAQTMC